MHSAETIRLINELYRSDFELFGYAESECNVHFIVRVMLP